jgi:glycosyltransferase involved in cell wall biosynthesis
MKIGFWLANASIDGGGVAPYALRVLELLLITSKNQEIEICILCSIEIENDCLELIHKCSANARLHLIPQFNVDWLLFFSSIQIDLLHVPYQTAPYYDLPCPVVITMHDVQELHYPEFFTPQERSARANYYWEALVKASAVIVSFDHVKQDLVKYFSIDESKIHICPLPYQNIELKQPNHEEILQIQSKYSRWNNFLLYPAQSWQHKNHLSLIRAIEHIKKNLDVSINLVCTGKKNPRFFPVIEKYLSKSQVNEQVYFTDIVPETELYWLYTSCSLVVIPTLYEAGSFPLLEAMSLDVPVICSSVTSLPETIGDLRFIFNPLDVTQMSNLIVDITKNSGLCAENIENSKNRINQLKQINSIDTFMLMYEFVISDSKISANILLNQTQSQLQQTQSQLQQTQSQLQQTQSQLQQTQSQLQQTQSQLQQTQNEVKSIKLSKSWKAGMQWVKLKNLINALFVNK